MKKKAYHLISLVGTVVGSHYCYCLSFFKFVWLSIAD